MSEREEFGYEAEQAPAGTLFVDDGQSLLVFPSVAAAERSLDPGDVEGGCYAAAYGREGETYRIRCEGSTVRFEKSGEPNSPDELKELLLRYCEDCEDPDDATTALQSLVQHAWTIERDYRLRCGTNEATARNRMPVWGCIVLAITVAAIAFLMLRWSGLRTAL